MASTGAPVIFSQTTSIIQVTLEKVWDLLLGCSFPEPADGINLGPT